MMRMIRAVWLSLLGSTVMAGAAGARTIGGPRPAVLRDVEGYAIAACLVQQAQPYLKDQGYVWAGAIVQRGKAPIEALTPVEDAVKRELDKGDMAIVHADANPPEDKAAPVLYCGEIIDKPAVRAAIQKTVAKLARRYRRQVKNG
jgi:hypothetical protein